MNAILAPFAWARSLLTGSPEPRPPNIPRVPVLTAKRATMLYGTPDGDPHGAWAKKNIVYCGGGGHPSCLPAMPGVPDRLWFAVHRRAEPKLRAAFTAARARCPEHVIDGAGCWVFRHKQHNPALDLSNHSWAGAVDINAAKNRGIKFAAKSSPAPFTPAWRKVYPDGLPQAWVEAFLSVGGIGWGGSWVTYRDPMHFEVYDPD